MPKSPTTLSASHGLGWRPDLPDHRDIIMPLSLTKLPAKVDWRPDMPPVYDQGQLGSCTANAIAAALDFERHKQGEQFINPSRLFIYYNERVMENSVASDAGAMIRDGIKSVKKLGDCPEAEWPYDISKFTNKPPAACYMDALKYKALTYQRVNHTNLGMLKSAVSVSPVVFGFTVYESFETAAVTKTGVVPMPAQGESVLGGHAVVAVGYDDSKKVFICRNSWGTGWGDKGYFYMPYQYLTVGSLLASDFWAIKTVL